MVQAAPGESSRAAGPVVAAVQAPFASAEFQVGFAEWFEVDFAVLTDPVNSVGSAHSAIERAARFVAGARRSRATPAQR